MMMKKLLFIISCLILIGSCKNNSENNLEKENSTESSTPKTSSLTVLPSKYLIAPPDSDYTGDYIDKYASGIVKFSGFFRFGERHGQWMAFYENGNMWSECYYDKGKKHGASNVYYPNGKPQYKGWYKNDLQDSVWMFYDTLGKVINQQTY